MRKSRNNTPTEFERAVTISARHTPMDTVGPKCSLDLVDIKEEAKKLREMLQKTKE